MDTVRQPSGAARLSFIVPHLSKSVHQVWFGGVNRAHYLDKRALSILNSLNLREKPVEVAAEMVRVKTVAGCKSHLRQGWHMQQQQWEAGQQRRCVQENKQPRWSQPFSSHTDVSKRDGSRRLGTADGYEKRVIAPYQQRPLRRQDGDERREKIAGRGAGASAGTAM